MMTKKSFPIFRYVLLVSLLLGSLVGWSQANESFDFAPIDKAHLYVPDNGDPLSFWKKSDLKISFDRHSDKNLNYYGFQPKVMNHFKLGFSALSNFYATASLFQYEGSGYMSGYYEEKMIMGDVGIGTYYSKFDTSRIKKKKKWMMQKGWQVNGLVGYSRGQMSHQTSYKIGQSEFNFNRIYGQTGFHFKRSIWGISTNLKFGLLNYSKTSIKGHAASDLAPLLDLLMRKNNFLFLESSSRIYLGTRFGQVYFNLVYAKSDTELEEYMVTNYKSIGVVFDIEEIFKKKEKENQAN